MNDNLIPYELNGSMRGSKDCSPKVASAGLGLRWDRGKLKTLRHRFLRRS
jgi:hypothetical protein